jgi:hypothetical protein
MRRREFIQAAGTTALGTSFLATSVKGFQEGNKNPGVTFLGTKTSGNMLFPRPGNEAEISITPVGLTWLPCPDADRYRVEIYRSGKRLIYAKTINKDPVFLPDQVLSPGKYQWDVFALDKRGNPIANRGEKSFVISKGSPELPWIEPEVLLGKVSKDHPRILYPRKALNQIRKTLNTTRIRSWKNCLAAAERALNTAAPKFPEYHLIEEPARSRLAYVDYFRYFRGFVNGALMDLSLAYLMTEEQKYATAAKRILLEISTWPTNDDDVTSVSARWGDEAGLSFAKCAHKAYDWLYTALDKEEKKLVLKMCQERAWQVYRRLKERKNYLTYPGESHDGRLIAYLSDMAIVLAHECEGPETWLEYSLKALTTFYPHWGGIDGGWAEGTAYGLWYNTYYIPAFEGLKYHCNFDLWKRPFFNNLRYFFFYCTAIRGEIRPFGDSAETGGPGVKGGSGYPELMWIHAHRYNDPYIGWWVNQIKDWLGNSGETALLFEDLPPIQKPVDLPNSRIFKGVGWAGLHSDIADPDNDTCMIFKSSPYGSVSHSHADQNSFAIMKGGNALAIPSGYYGPAYGQPHHAEWTRSTKANNCILVDGEGQVIREARANGNIIKFEEKPGFTYLAGDATPAYMGKLNQFVRHILFLRPAVFLLLDELEAPQPARFQWMFHAFEEMQMINTQIISHRNGTRLEVYLNSKEALQLSQSNQFDTPYNQGIPQEFQRDVAPQWHVTVETKEPQQKIRIAAVMIVSGPTETIRTELLAREGWFGVRATAGNTTAEGWIQTETGISGPAGFSQEISDGKACLFGKDRDGYIFFI